MTTPRGAVASAPAVAEGPRRLADDRLPLGVLLSIPIVATALGFPYYLLGPAERLRSPLHHWLRSSAGVGLAFGVAGLALFLFMWLYPVRKKLRWLAPTGSVAGWLRIHVMVGLALPLVVAVHAGWRFEGLIGLGYLAMVLVVLSGMVGRYLYVRIPRSRNGIELTRDEIANQRRAILTRIAAATGLDPAAIERALAVDARPDTNLGLAASFARMVRDDLSRRRAARSLEREWRRAHAAERTLDRAALDSALRLARREIGLTQQLHMLDATRRVFAFWHVAHRPVAVTALLAILIHVAVAVVVGGVLMPSSGAP